MSELLHAQSAFNAPLLIDNEVETRNDYGMLSSTRSAGFLSTCLKPVLSLLAIASLAGCPDTQGALDEFESRIPDARPPAIQYDAAVVSEVPDVTGTALLSLNVPSVVVLQSRAEIVLTPVGEGASMDLTLTLLTANTREPVGTPVTIEDIAVDNTASFVITIPVLDIPPQANPLGNAATATDVELTGTVRSTDLACGTVTKGTAVAGPVTLPLAGSTFGAKRVPTGSTGAALGDPVVACP
jgi:hypothetical protein